ncbi:uncharacterized protein VTP21DRAFT_6267 [Calcarisporiella thermophila]|uniref:uncharacterized protein n=1 Tax=Calcarisporiella thermophila TaxID=911321 RepID=UPI0037433590
MVLSQLSLQTQPPSKMEDVIFNVILWCYAAVIPLLFIALFFINAPYGNTIVFVPYSAIHPNLTLGRFSCGSTVNGRVGWFLIEITSPVVFLLSLRLRNSSLLTAPKLFLSALWLGHYFNRAVVYTIRAPSLSPMHYIVILSGIGYNVLNGYTNGRWIGLYSSYGEDFFGLRCLVGFILFAAGMALNIHHDNILFGLRRKKEKVEENSGRHRKRYFIPYGGLFRYVSCPSYFCESIEWIGFAVAAWYSPPALLFAASTPANLLPRALRTHAWYRRTFGDKYPSDRRAFVPFLI